MTTVENTPQAVDLVTVTIDGIQVSVPKDTLVIRAAEQIGVQIPRFCDHPLLAPLGACRQCIVEVEGQRKPVAACTTTVADGMVVATQATSPTNQWFALCDSSRTVLRVTSNDTTAAWAASTVILMRRMMAGCVGS